ncbi:MAG: hypothetical protein L6R19_05830 [Alphaproteobacteria bacterium]|nr:hypothetical protein [Alphaproteobacteria bacterium]
MPRKSSEKFGANARVSSPVGPAARWVGMHEGRIAATDRSLGRLIARLKKDGIPVEEATFRLTNDHAQASA